MSNRISMNRIKQKPPITGVVSVKVMDVDGESVSKETLRYLKAEHLSYRDMLHKEHLYSVSETDEVLEKEKEEVQKEVAHLFELADTLDASYIRFIWHP